IERNILDFQALGKQLGYPWQVQAPCMLMKTNVPRLVEFGEWCITNNVQPGFYDFINAAGIEKTHEAENLLVYPELVDQIPEWERYFVLAIDRLRNSQWTPAAEQLNVLYTTIRSNKEKAIEARVRSETEARVRSEIEASVRDEFEAKSISQNPASMKQSIKQVTPPPIWEMLRRMKRASKSIFGSPSGNQSTMH
ncbi:MAG: hypothetical protein ACTHLX_07320, partial [Candidatus Binatia bacterium]